MSDVKRKILYSTDPNFIDHEKIKNLAEAEKIQIIRSKEESVNELRPLSKDIVGDNKNLTPLISIENFMYYWYPKIKAYIEEGRDIVNEANPDSSIFVMWGKEHIRSSDGYRVGISRSNTVEIEEETNRKKVDFEVLVTTPGLTIDPMIGIDAFQSLDLEHVAGNIVKNPIDVQREQEMREFTEDLTRIHDEEVIRSNLEQQREDFKNEWRRALKDLEVYYEEYKKNGGYLPPKTDINTLKANTKPDKYKKQEDDDDDVEWDY